MKLFLPSLRASIALLIVGCCSLGYALYLRYRVIEPSTVGLACGAGLDSGLCLTRRYTIGLFQNSVFGGTAMAAAVLNLLHPSLVFFTLALATAAFGLVLYNVALSALAVALLAVSFARRAPEPE
jgi:hypothetical protein